MSLIGGSLVLLSLLSIASDLSHAADGLAVRFKPEDVDWVNKCYDKFLDKCDEIKTNTETQIQPDTVSWALTSDVFEDGIAVFKNVVEIDRDQDLIKKFLLLVRNTTHNTDDGVPRYVAWLFYYQTQDSLKEFWESSKGEATDQTNEYFWIKTSHHKWRVSPIPDFHPILNTSSFCGSIPQ